MKKIVTFLLSLVLLVPCVLMFTACGKTPPDDDTTKVMNVELNPQLEFILNTEDKVVSVNALNDEGNRIISLVADANLVFENLTAEDAVELFLQITKDNGYLVSGNEEQITVSISGSTQDLLNSVKSSINTYLTENDIDISVVTDKILKSDIVQQVQDCMREYTETELNKMSEEELINLLKQSRDETKDFLTQEIKDLYYQLRAEELTKAKFEKLEEILESSQSEFVSSYLTQVTEYLTQFTTKLTTFTEQFQTQFLNDSTYNDAMIAYAQIKQQLLDARLDPNTTDQQLAEIESQLKQAETALLNAKGAAEQAMIEVSALVETATQNLNSMYNSMLTVLNTIFTNLETQLNTAIAEAEEDFIATFESTYADYIGDNSYWTNIPELTPAQ